MGDVNWVKAAAGGRGGISRLYYKHAARLGGIVPDADSEKGKNEHEEGSKKRVQN